MTGPSVMCIMLTQPGREAMAMRAIAAFQTQTYPNRRLLILDSCLPRDTMPKVTHHHEDNRILRVQASGVDCETGRKLSIGRLRNSANDFPFEGVYAWREKPDLFAHWDDDDWSHPLRLEEQVAYITSEVNAPCVGYNEMLFWDTSRFEYEPEKYTSKAEAWLYSNANWAQPLGTSLLYWREAWEKNQFQDFDPSTGAEDVRFLDRCVPRPRGVSSYKVAEPRMIATVHGRNTSSKIDPANPIWTRVPEWDGYCRAVLDGHWKPAATTEVRVV